MAQRGIKKDCQTSETKTTIYLTSWDAARVGKFIQANVDVEKEDLSWVWWYTPVIPATWEADTGEAGV
jgi:hypothetical protein